MANHNQHVFNLKNNPVFLWKLQDMLSTFEFNKQNPEIVMSAKLYELLGLMLVNSTSGNADNMGSWHCISTEITTNPYPWKSWQRERA